MTGPAGRTIDAALQLLDRQILDRDGRLAGKVDDVELAVSPDDGSLLVTALLSGPGALAPRLQGTFGPRWERLCRLLLDAEGPEPLRIGLGSVTRIGSSVRLSTSRDDLASMRAEHWVRRNFIGAIPGAGDAAPQ